MPSYGSFGGLDDQVFTDGDVGFVGMNQRLQPNQLGAGEVVLSRNGRMDGYWQPRKGIRLRSGALSSSEVPLQIPFWVVDDAGGYDGGYPTEITVSGVTSPAALNGVYVYVSQRDGKPEYSQNGLPHGSGGDRNIYWSEPDGLWLMINIADLSFRSTEDVQLPQDVTSWVSSFGATGTPSLAVTDTSVITASRVGELVTLDAIMHPFTVGESAWVGVSGFSGSIDPNGVRYVTAVDENTLIYEITGVTGNETYTGTGTLISELDDDAVSAIYGSCLFSDPSSNLDESVILATNFDAKRVALEDYTVTSIPYPSGLVLDGPCEMLQAMDRVLLLREGERPMEWIPNGKPIVSAALATNVVTVEVIGHGLADGDGVTISGLTYTGTDPNGARTVTVVDADTFTFPLTSANETYGVTAAKVVANGFTYKPGGPYTQPQTFIVASNAGGFSVVDGLVSIPVVDNTTIKAGDFVTIYETTIAVFSSIVGQSFQVVSATETLITFYAPVGNYTAGGSNQIEFGGRFSIGGGFIHMPAPPWSIYFQRRLWSPYWYEPNGTVDSPVYWDRKVRDEIVASDILDSDTHDQIYSQFRITAGIADYTVAMHPFFDDALMVLNRNSLHLIRGTQGSLQDTVVTELTREIGCLARKSVVSKGNTTFFLSDNGVYGVEFIDQYNLRGVQEPLSKNIQPIIDRINRNLASGAVGIFFNNRYWLALPLDSAPGKGDASGNNSVVIFNTLNGGWESLDDYNIPQFHITNFVVGQSGERNSLYLINEFGGLHEVDSREQPVDDYSTNAIGGASSTGVTYELVSRGYMLGSSNYERKKFLRAQVQLKSDTDASNVDFFFSSEDPDTDKFRVSSINEMLDMDLPSQESANFRMRLGNPRGLYGTLTISSVSVGSAPVGRPKVNSITVDGTITNRQTISQH